MFKPYQLVCVSQPVADSISGVHRTIRRYVGEAMSFPTPEGTIMVRRVPGFAGTMEEMPIEWVSKCVWRTAVVHVAAVSGRGMFPTDMLRYDQCVPINFTLDDAMRPKIIVGLSDELLIARCMESKRVDAFTKPRWESFGWQLRNVTVESVR